MGVPPERVSRRSVQSGIAVSLVVPLVSLLALWGLAAGVVLSGAPADLGGSHALAVRLAVVGAVGFVAVLASAIVLGRFARRLSADVASLQAAASRVPPLDAQPGSGPAGTLAPTAVAPAAQAGASDARASDAGGPDARALDAGGSDARALDAGGSDSGGSDSGGSDSGGSDAGASRGSAPPARPGFAEFDQVAEALSRIGQARAAAADAGLRSGISQVFVSLARRNQSLLHRQLRLLDELERKADDPAALSDLFHLDHLTTRMRRHAESLIILSGATPGRVFPSPVPLIDVIRGAIAEVEDYTRLVVATRDEDAVAGPVVADVIHLLAELIENATLFSPAGTRVEIRASRAANGIAIEVEDRGLGLQPAELEATNARLASPPDVDLATADQLGLYVVAKLAARHSLRVSLRPSPYGGTTAIVLLPNRLIIPAEFAGASQARPLPGRGHGEELRLALTAGARPDPAGLPSLPPASGPAGVSVPDAGSLLGAGRDSAAAVDPTAVSLPVRDGLPDAGGDPAAASLPVRGGLPDAGGGPAAASLPVRGALPDAGADPAAPSLPGLSQPEYPTDPSLRLPSRDDRSWFAPSRGSSSLPGPAWQLDPDPDPQPPAQPLPSPPSGTTAGSPVLPRRVRQANMSPRLRGQPEAEPAPDPAPRSPELARDLMSAMQSGWQRGRQSTAMDSPDVAGPEPASDAAGSPPSDAQHRDEA